VSGAPERPDPAGERLGRVLALGALLLVYHDRYDAWSLPPQLAGTFGRVLAGDVLPLLVAPLLVIRLLLRAPAWDFGWRARPVGRLLGAALLAWLAVLPVAVPLAFQPEFSAFYPSRAFPPAREHVIGLAFLWLLHHAPQLLALESFLRGFVWFPLLRRAGFARSVAVLLPLYVLLHLGKPPLELALAAWGGLVFMAAAARTGSFLPAFAAHWLVAVTVDALCYAQLRGLL
jgi:hypothetical protein